MYLHVNIPEIVEKRSYNHVPMNQQNFDNPRTLVPVNNNDSTGCVFTT